MVSVIGTMGTGFLQNDAAWRELPKLPPGDSTLAVLLPPARSRTGRARSRASPTSSRSATISIARLLQQPNGNGAALHVVTHEGRAGALDDALAGARRAARGAPALAAAAGDLRPRRCGARMGVTLARPPRSRSAKGSTPLVPRRGCRRTTGCEPAPEVRRRESDGQLQGSRHGRRGRSRSRVRRARGRLRLDRQHRRLRGCLRRARGAARRSS